MDDRISELPQLILHHILSFLSQKQSVQTCVLAKSWRHLGSTRPKLEFSERHIPWPSFIHTVDKTLQRYEDQNLSIQEFLLEVSGDHRSDIFPFLEKWIPIVLSLRGLKKLYLNLFSFNFNSRGVTAHALPVTGYALPQEVFQAESIQVFSLGGCKISSAENVMFRNLQALTLSNVEIEDEAFERIISSCPSIQQLGLFGCPGLRTVQVKNAQNLKIFFCLLYANVVPIIENDSRIEIDVPTTLQRIQIGDCHNWYCYHDNKFFPNLKSLCMDKVRLSTESFDIFSSDKIPCLEDLELSCCYGFEEFKLSSRSIKRLIIRMASKSPFRASIDAPNILYFKLACNSFREISSPFSFTRTSSGEWKSNISVTCCLDSNNHYLSKWFRELDEILKALSRSKITLNIDCLSFVNGQHIEGTYEGFNEPVVVEHLSLQGSFSSSVFPGFLNYLFSICRPRCIYNVPKMYCESLCKVLLQERERMDCFWQQDLEDISTEEEKDYDGKEWPRFLASSLSKEKTRIRLKWRELS